MASISSPGIGSGLNINSIISQLMTAAGQPLTVLDRKEAVFQAKLSAYGSLKGALSSYQSAMRDLSEPKAFADWRAMGVASSKGRLPGSTRPERVKVNSLRAVTVQDLLYGSFGFWLERLVE